MPQAIIEKVPSAGLWLGQTDEAEMGFSYADLERYLTDGPEGVSPALALRLERMIRATEHKRSLPPTPDRNRGHSTVTVPELLRRGQSRLSVPELSNTCSAGADA